MTTPDDNDNLKYRSCVTPWVEHMGIIGMCAENKELKENAQEHERLKQVLNEVLHPNGDGPKNPSFCDLVSYVK